MVCFMFCILSILSFFRIVYVIIGLSFLDNSLCYLLVNLSSSAEWFVVCPVYCFFLVLQNRLWHVLGIAQFFCRMVCIKFLVLATLSFFLQNGLFYVLGIGQSFHVLKNCLWYILGFGLSFTIFSMHLMSASLLSRRPCGILNGDITSQSLLITPKKKQKKT